VDAEVVVDVVFVEPLDVELVEVVVSLLEEVLPLADGVVDELVLVDIVGASTDGAD
jgi:hypothetical protein